MISRREPLVTDVIGFMDGVLFTTECTSKRVEQNAYYCGYDCDLMVNNVFMFVPDGKIFVLQLIILGVGQMGLSQLVSFRTSSSKSGDLKSVLTKVSHGVVMRMAF